jgi:hypothetical protein
LRGQGEERVELRKRRELAGKRHDFQGKVQHTNRRKKYIQYRAIQYVLWILGMSYSRILTQKSRLKAARISGRYWHKNRERKQPQISTKIYQ